MRRNKAILVITKGVLILLFKNEEMATVIPPMRFVENVDLLLMAENVPSAAAL